MLAISPALLQAIHAHGEAAYPNEGAGLLLGRVHGDTGEPAWTVADILPLDNQWRAEEQSHRFLLTSEDWLAGEAEAERRSLDLIGCFHSHPDHVAVPSEFDRLAALPNFLYVITSVTGGKAAVSRAWLLSDDHLSYSETPITPAAQPAR